MSRTFLRSDSLSIVSRQSVLAILVACLTVFGVGNAWGTTQTFTFNTTAGHTELGISSPSTGSGTDLDASHDYTLGNVTMNITHGGTNTRIWNSAGSYSLRVYKTGGSLTFSVPAAYYINSVEINTSTNLSATTPTGGSWDTDTWSPAESTYPTSVTFSASGTATITTIVVTYSANCDKKVTVSNGGSSTNGSITSITTSPVATCSSTASERQVSIVVTPSTGYVAPTALSVGSTTGTVTSTKVSRTDNGNGTFTFVYQYNQNDNGTISYNAACVGKQCTVTFDKNSGTGGDNSVTATYGSAMTAITPPTREHFDFGGYYDSETDNDGTGNKYYNANGSSAANWNKNTTAATTLYAKWTEHGLKNYRTVCCTDLGAIDGEATLTQGGNSVTISGWSDVANVGTYTVKLYKKNGASWDLVSGSTSGGSAGAQGTRTGITSGSKSVTYTGLEVESEYKFTVQAIAGSAAYCDGVETAVTEINDVDVSSTPFKFRYSIYIDNGSNSGWAHHYIEPTGNTDEGSVSISLGAHVDYYQFKIAGGFSGWWGQSGSSKIPANTKWTLDSDQNVRLETGAGGAYTFTVDYSGTTNPGVTVTFPSADQAADYKIYFDKSAVADWGATLKYRIGNGSHNQNQNFTLVPGTDNFYVTTTPSYSSMDAWQIANNVAWTPGNSGEYDAAHGIYNYYHYGDANNITRATVYQDYAVDEDITIVPSSKHNTENSCDFWDVSKTSGMLTHTATITTPSHGTINIAYTDVSGTSQPTNTSTVADLAHRTILTITATPATGYTCTSLTVNGVAFTSGSTHILAADATIAATFTAQTSTVTLDNNSATSGSQQTVTATYDAAMPLVTTADGTPAVAALTRTGYTFNGWWDETSGGNQYYTYSGSPKVIASARTWDKTGAQTLKAQWIVNQYMLTWDLQGGTVATAGTGAAAAATGTPSSSQDYGTALTAPIVTKTGYNFNVWSPSVAATMPAENTTYTASWTAQVYNITYKDQGDNAYSGNATAGVPTGAPTTHTYGSATALVDGVKDGYRFDGWFTDASCTVSAGSSIGATAKTADFTLYAKWTQVYTVTWHVGNGTWSVGEHNVNAGNTQVVSGSQIASMPDAPADNTLSACANKFMGWSTHSWGSTPKGTGTGEYDDLFTDVAGSPTISANMDIYAVFAEQTTSDGYKYIGDAGTLTDGKKYIFVSAKTAGSAYALKATDLAAPNSGNNGTAVSVTVTSNSEGILVTTVNTALEFEYVSSGSKLQYEVDGPATRYLFINGDGVGMKSDDNRSRYTTDAGLQGWNNKVTTYYDVYYNSTNDKFERKESADSRVYAFIKQTPTYANYRTQCDANLVKVTYDADGGSTTCADGSHDKRNDYTVCATEPTKDYYEFAGWLCSADSKTYAASATIDDAVIDDDFTLTAQWAPVTYNITYNLYGGTNSGSNPATYNVTTATITLQDPTKGHDRFEGWFSTYSAGVYSDQVTSIPLGSHGDITLHAKWAERHEIIFDADGTTTTIYRADDENLEDDVVGQGSVPGDPSAPTACSSKVFVGWSESEIDDETDDEPADLMKPAAGTVDADKHYYAVWAIESTSLGPVTVFNDAFARVDNGTAYGDKGKLTTSYVFGTGTAGEARMSNSSSGAGSIDIDLSDKSLESTLTVTFKLKYWTSGETGSVSLTCMDEGATASFGSSPFAYPTTSGWHDFSSTVTGVDDKVKSINFGSTAGKRVYIKDIVITQTGTIYSYTAYSTSCCVTKVTLSQNSPSNGTIAFGKTSVGTCGGDKDVSLTITPAAGYQLATYSVATGDGKVATKTDPGVELNNNSSAVQNKTLTFASGASGAYDVTASFTLMTVSSWTWTYNSAAIPNPLNLYEGQSAKLDVAYTPAGVDASKKTYTRNKDNTYINWVGGLNANYSTISGRASTGENTTAVTFTHADGPETVVNVKVLPLPLVHFTDLVHGKAFADVVATIEANALSATKTTPTSDDWTTPNANTCEENHLHLVGWIREDWPALVAYLAGTGDQPSTTAITTAGNDDLGNAYFFTAGASINVQTFDGVTFYAVWGKME